MDRYRVRPGTAVKLADWDAGDTSAFPAGKDEASVELDRLRERLVSFQETLWAEKRRKVLVVLQAMDTGGKDGTIRHVLTGVNPQGVSVVGFGTPCPDELAHDYLWRIHLHAPSAGRITIFNRSHYEDVLVVRVHNLVPKDVWKRRYAHINAFEKMLADEGTAIVKFFLLISKDEQKRRLQDRLAEADKRWKFHVSDLAERDLWDDYVAAYEAVLSRTSTAHAPWYIVPADHKWYRNLVVSNALVKLMEGLHLHVPEIDFDPGSVSIS